MDRGQDFEWDRTVGLPERELDCGFCGGNITSQTGFAGWERLLNQRLPHYIYICHKCGQPNFFNIAERQFPLFRNAPIKFPESVVAISPRFVEIHKQAQLAEIDGLNEIAGPGYGKALEFLIKDYLIKSLPEQENEIKKMKLYDCIHKKVENAKIKALADKARIVRNDETHYERKYEDSDLVDLKKLIGATAAWIELEHFTVEQIG